MSTATPRMLAAALAAALSCTAFGALADRPDRATRLKLCESYKSNTNLKCYPKVDATGTKVLALNLHYGWHVGKSHPISNDNPPSYDKLLNGMDQCAWYHDRGAWRWNPRTKVCEGTFMCANTVGLFRCLSDYKPETKDEQDAKDVAMHSLGRMGETCIRALYKDYGHGFFQDAHGSQWLKKEAVKELAEAFDHCGPGMAIPGYDKVRAKAGKLE